MLAEMGRSVARTGLACVGAVVVSRWMLSLIRGIEARGASSGGIQGKSFTR